jgi:hypothetical protein
LVSTLGPQERRKGFEYGKALQRYASRSRNMQEMGNRPCAGYAAERAGFKISVRAAVLMQMHRHSRHDGGT